MQVKDKSRKRRAFTIVELLTVMSVIIILISLLVPALNQVKRFAKEVKQRAQFHSIDVAMELYETEHQEYPDSDREGSDEQEYCGAMKLAEAMVGQDVGGFHMDSVYRSDLKNASGDRYLYAIPGNAASENDTDTEANRQARKGPYLSIENANATRMGKIYDGNDLKHFTNTDNDKLFVLCDEYTRKMMRGTKTGMPILYYKANLAGDRNPSPQNKWPVNPAETQPQNIYDYKDNDDLVDEGNPWGPTPTQHPMDSDQPDSDPTDGLGVRETFYFRIWNDDIPLKDGRPYRSDSYILLSAGFDGLYGTRDDIYNFPQ